MTAQFLRGGVGNGCRQAIGQAADAATYAQARLYQLGGAAALLAGLVFRRNLDAELLGLKGLGLIHAGPPALPESVRDWFILLHADRLYGLTLLNFFDMVNYVLVGLAFFAACVALRHVSRAAVLAATGLTSVALALYFASNRALGMLALCDQYAAAVTDAQQSRLLAAGEAALAIHRHATYHETSLYPSFFLISVAGLLIAAAMLPSRRFGKVTAWLGILANVFGLSYYVVLLAAPALVALPLSISAVFLLAWYIQMGRRFLIVASVTSVQAVDLHAESKGGYDV